MPATVERVEEEDDLKYSSILAAEPEVAAVEARAAREAQAVRAVLVWVSLVPVQSDCTAWRSARAWKERRTIAAEAPSTVAVKALVVKAKGSAARVLVLLSTA